MRSTCQLLLCVALCGLLGGCATYNQGVQAQLRAEPQGLRAQKLLLLNLPDGREIPLRYVRHSSQTLYVGAGGRWWRQIQPATTVQLFIQGRTHKALAQVVLNEPALKRTVFSKLRSPLLARLPRWLGGGVLVRLQLDG